MAPTKFRSAVLSWIDQTGFATMLSASKFRPNSGREIEASSIKRADMVVTISRNWACASTARDEVLITATGFPGNSKLLTSQSSAFFNEPGRPRAYSGDE